MSRFLILISLLVLSSSVAFGQAKLKKKYHGIYNGQINSYKMDTGGEVLEVGAVPIQIDLYAGYLNVHIGKTTSKGYYTILFEAEEYYVLDAVMDNNSIGERIIVYKKGEKLSRDGLFPQPSAVLKRTSK